MIIIIAVPILTKDNNDITGEDRAPLFLVLNGLNFMTT